MRLDHEFTSISWLQDHHESKLPERREIVASLDIHEGDVIMDLGCGPGLWSSLFSELIGQPGRIVGYDLEHDYLRHALGAVTQRIGSPPTSLIQGDFAAPPFRNEVFDLIFSCNALLYHPAPMELIRSLARLLRPGGKIAVVHFDDAMTCYHPIEPELTLRVLTATAEALRGQVSGPPYDNYLGRKLHSLFVQSGLVDVKTSIHPVHRQGPLGGQIEKHIAGIALWQARVGASHLDNETLSNWMSYFDSESPSYVLQDEVFSFYAVDFLTVGKRRPLDAEPGEASGAGG